MKFTDMLITNKKIDLVEVVEDKIPQHIIVEEAKAEDVLRKAGYKIKMVTGTAFGTQIDLFKEPNDDIEEVLKDFNIKIKGKQLFVVL